ncbi:MAG: HD-GYP domain-containing protein [Treponemataceae bacterium]
MIYKTSDLKPDTYFSADFFLDDKFILTHPLIPIREELLNSLSNWDIKEIQSEGQLIEKELLNDSVEYALLKLNIHDSNELITEINTQIKKDIKSKKISFEEGKKKLVLDVYTKCKDTLNDFFVMYTTTKKLDVKKISDFLMYFSAFIIGFSQELLKIQISSTATKEELFLHHALRSTILSILMGKELKYSHEELTLLGIAACLHEIGMLKISPQMHMHGNNLSSSERKSILMHPVFSYSILEACQFPKDVCVAVLDHHEQQNGSGYPRKIFGNNISPFAKIIAVACTFEAITAPRTYQESRGNHKAILELLKNAKTQFDPHVLWAFVSVMSIYPIGTYVRLTNGKDGIVIDISTMHIKMPVVQVLQENKNLEPEIIKTYDSNIKIERSLTNKEVAALPASLKEDL